MPRNVIVYDILLSCPSDIPNNYIEDIRKAIDTFNETVGQDKQIRLESKNWKSDSCPVSGKKGQEAINEQIVDKCDAAIAMFWTKFGSPTEKCGSGTEEEIETMIKDNKNVFLYFLDKPLSPNIIDTQQLEKVKEFKKKYEKNNYYHVISGNDNFKDMVLKHLSKYFCEEISKNNSYSVNTINILLPELELVDALTQNPKIVKSVKNDFTNSDFLQNKCNEIKELIKFLLDNKLHKKRIINNSNFPGFLGSIKGVADEYKNVSHNFLFPNMINAEIPDSWKKEIVNFANVNSINIDDCFWNLGDLKISEHQVIIDGIDTTRLDGKKEEKKRYNSVKELYNKIDIYNSFVNFYSKIDVYNLVYIALNNYGRKKDQDIDIKIRIPKQCIVTNNELVFPNDSIIEELLANNFHKKAFASEFKNINSYKNYEVINNFFYLTLNNNEMEDKLREKYRDTQNSIICYEHYEEENFDIYKCHIDELKHNTLISLPSALIFKDLPKKIEYEITSENMPEKVIGVISIEK